MYLKKLFFVPGGESENAASTRDNEEKPETVKAPDSAEEKPLGEKIKEALQDWSNKDEADQEFDDTRV